MPTPVGARAALACLLFAIPAAARADSTAQKYYYEDILSPFFVLEPARGVYVSKRPGAVPSEFSAVKSSDTFRVFVLGGSIAGLLHSKDGPGEFGESLAAVLPTKKVEVLNCGMAGYDSSREALVEQEILEYAPDLIVLLTGHNEGLASAPMPLWIMHAQDRLARYETFRALVRKLHPESGVVPATTDVLSDQRDAVFAKTLGENLRKARERGVPVAVVIPPRNYREPVESDRTLYDPEFSPGWILFLKGDHAGARDFWKAALASTGRPSANPAARRAFLLGFVARAEEKLGLWKEARESFEAAARSDRASICGGICQDILRRTAAEEGAFLVEADRMFRAAAYPRMPGLETFNDRMHWKPRFNCQMSGEIISSLRAHAKLGALPWSESRIKALSAACVKPGGAGSLEDDRRILGYVQMGLSWPGPAILSTVSVFYLQALRRERPEWFRDVPALAAMKTSPTTQIYGAAMGAPRLLTPRFYWHVGEVLLLEKDHRGAVAAFTKALELEPALSWARLSRAVALALSGDKRGALAGFQEVIARDAAEATHAAVISAAVTAGVAAGLPREELAAGDPDFWLEKAGLAVDAGRREDGLAALAKARALTLQPYQARLLGQYENRLRPKGATDSTPATAKEATELEGLLVKAGAAASAGLVRRVEGLAMLDRARALSPQPHEVRLIAQYYRRFGEMNKFLELSDDLTKLYPADPDLWVTRAEAAFSVGRKDVALEALARAETLAPGDAQKKLIADLREAAKK